MTRIPDKVDLLMHFMGDTQPNSSNDEKEMCDSFPQNRHPQDLIGLEVKITRCSYDGEDHRESPECICKWLGARVVIRETGAFDERNAYYASLGSIWVLIHASEFVLVQ